jgi:hypothetical protein
VSCCSRGWSGAGAGAKVRIVCIGAGGDVSTGLGDVLDLVWVALGGGMTLELEWKRELVSMLEEGVEVRCSGAGADGGAGLGDDVWAKVEVRVGVRSREGWSWRRNWSWI